MFLKMSAQPSEAGDFLNICLRFLGFQGLFFYKKFYYKKLCILHLFTFNFHMVLYFAFFPFNL